MTQGHAKVEPSLLTLKRSIIFMFVLASIMSLVSYVASDALFTQLQNNLTVVGKAGDRAVYFQVGRYHTPLICLHSYTWAVGFAAQWLLDVVLYKCPCIMFICPLQKVVTGLQAFGMHNEGSYPWDDNGTSI
jgi:hypothetical protein